MRHRRNAKLLHTVVITLLGLTGFQAEGLGMGWLEKKVKEHEQVYWKHLEQAKPLIKERADRILGELGYHPDTLIAVVFPKGEGGDEIWTVKYWQTDPGNYDKRAGGRGNFEVYLNYRGMVKRVTRFENGTEQLLYGKDERIDNGMTPEQVRERLGESDYKGPPPRDLRDLADETWKYKATPDRAVRIEVFFKDGKVVSVDTFGE